MRVATRNDMDFFFNGAAKWFFIMGCRDNESNRVSLGGVGEVSGVPERRGGCG